MAEALQLHSQLKDVPLIKMRVSPRAQRRLVMAHVHEIVARFDLELFGHPVVSFRDGHYYIVDAQHRIKALQQWLGEDWRNQSVTCRVYTGMNEAQEAKMFRDLNSGHAVHGFDDFRVGVTANDPECVAITNVLESQGLHLSREHGEGNVSAVGALTRVYRRGGAKVLARALHIASRSFGDPGLTNRVIDGIAMLCERYNGALGDDDAIDKFQSMRGGVGALMSRAETLRKQTAANVPSCVAAAAVDALNARRGGKKLPSWWKVA